MMIPFGVGKILQQVIMFFWSDQTEYTVENDDKYGCVTKQLIGGTLAAWSTRQKSINGSFCVCLTRINISLSKVSLVCCSLEKIINETQDSLVMNVVPSFGSVKSILQSAMFFSDHSVFQR